MSLPDCCSSLPATAAGLCLCVHAHRLEFDPERSHRSDSTRVLMLLLPSASVTGASAGVCLCVHAHRLEFDPERSHRSDSTRVLLLLLLLLCGAFVTGAAAGVCQCLCVDAIRVRSREISPIGLNSCAADAV